VQYKAAFRGRFFVYLPNLTKNNYFGAPHQKVLDRAKTLPIIRSMMQCNIATKKHSDTYLKLA
jgi:hypothetical protein